MNHVEELIVDYLIEELLSSGYTIGVNDGEETTLKHSTNPETIKEHLCTTDMNNLIVYKENNKVLGHISLVWGNDEDVIHDHTDNASMRDVMDKVQEYVEFTFSM